MIDPSQLADLPSEGGVSRDLREAIEALFFGYREFTDRADRLLAGRGLGRVHHRILYFVGRNPGVSVKGLLEILGVSKQAVNAPLRQLIEMNLIAAGAGSSDKRIKNLSLTEDGRAFEVALTGAQARYLARAFDAAGPGTRAGWKAVMDVLASPDGKPKPVADIDLGGMTVSDSVPRRSPRGLPFFLNKDLKK